MVGELFDLPKSFKINFLPRNTLFKHVLKTHPDPAGSAIFVLACVNMSKVSARREKIFVPEKLEIKGTRPLALNQKEWLI